MLDCFLCGVRESEWGWVWAWRKKAAKELEFVEAAKLRDEYLAIQKMIEERKN